MSLVRRLLTITLLALGMLPLAAARLSAQAGTITGKVSDAAGQPLEGAQVQAQAAGQTFGAVSAANGTFRISNVPAGSYTVIVRRIGYSERRYPGVDVTNGGQTTVNAELSETATVLNPTVVTASRSRPEKALDAPAQISVISSERIEERPSVTVTDHLLATPGVSINRGGIAQANIVARGFNNAFSGSMLMLQDYRFAGVPSLRVNVPFLFTGTNEDIDRIEVLLGPASALYGPNSANGVLHVITKSPFASQGTTVSLDGGERDVLRGSLRHAGVLSERLGYKLSGEYMKGRDWPYNDLTEPTTFPSTTNVPESRRGQPNARNFDVERYTGEARLDIRPNDKSEAITTLGYTKILNGIELTGANGAAQAKNWSYTSLQQRYRYNRLFLQAFMNLSDAGNDDATSASGTYLLRSGQPIVDQSRVFALQAQHGFDLGVKQSFTYGVDYIKTDPRTGGTINGANEDVDNVSEYGAYLQSTTRPINWLEVLLAARIDENNVIEDPSFSPRAALIFKPTETQNLRLTYNRAFATPANFSFFLDLISSPNVGGSGFDVVARGNPPKEGFQFNRSCTTSAFGAYCMRSAYAQGGEARGVSAAAAFNGFITARETALRAGVSSGLKANGIPAATADQLAVLAVNSLKALQPTDANLATRVSYLTSPTTALDPNALADIDPLKASYNTTYEIGYKGIVGNRFRYDVAFWNQERGDVGTSAALATPSVFLGNPTQVGAYIGTPLGAALGPALAGAGLSATQINAIVTGLTTSLTTSLASAPLGVVTFAGANTSPTALYAVYQNTNKKLYVSGLDLATDVVATDRLTFEATYSYTSKNVFKNISGGNGAPLMSNAPNSRGSLGARYRNEVNGFGFESRLRYSEAYPVNSGVYATNTAFAIAAGQPGAPTTTPTALGYGKCNPAAAGTFCYENVPEAFLVDAQVSKRFDVGAQRLTWSISATNLFDNPIRTFPGVPEMGRMVMTRIQYQF